MPELRTARENARLEIGSQRGRNSHQIGILGIYGLQGLNYGRTELLVADMRLGHLLGGTCRYVYFSSWGALRPGRRALAEKASLPM